MTVNLYMLKNQYGNLAPKCPMESGLVAAHLLSPRINGPDSISHFKGLSNRSNYKVIRVSMGWAI